MLIIPIKQGYIVTDGHTWVRTFDTRDSAIAFAYQMELYYPRMSVLMRLPIDYRLSVSLNDRAG